MKTMADFIKMDAKRMAVGYFFFLIALIMAKSIPTNGIIKFQKIG
jgi:hypothetical protein